MKNERITRFDKFQQSYFAKGTFQEIIDYLGKIEDKIESGTMIELKAKVNDTVFWITSNFEIVEVVIIDIKIIEHGIVYNVKEKNGCEYSMFNVELFKTKDEAEDNAKSCKNKDNNFYEAIGRAKTYKTFKEFYEDYAMKYFTYEYSCKLWEIKERV